MSVNLVTFSPNTIMSSTDVNSNFSGIASQVRPTFTFTITGSLTVGTNMTPALVVPLALTIEKAYAYVKTAPVGADILIDINKNGTSIWATNQANRLDIVAGNNTDTSSSFDTTALAESDYLTIDLDEVGSSTAGSDLTVALKCS